MRTLRRAAWVWIALAALALAHAMLVGGGIVRPLLLWQLRRNGEVDATTTYFITGIVLIGLPSLLFLIGRKRAKPPPVPVPRQWLLASFGAAALLFAMLAGSAVYSVLALPDHDDPFVRVELDNVAAELTDGRAVLIGDPRPQYLFEYDEVSGGGKTGPTRHYPHSLLPITPADWAPGQQVHFLLDLHGRGYQEVMQRTRNGEWTTRPGYLLHGKLRDFEAHAASDLGVVLADDVMLYSTDRLDRSNGLIAFATVCGIFGLVSLLVVLVTWRIKPRGAA